MGAHDRVAGIRQKLVGHLVRLQAALRLESLTIAEIMVGSEPIDGLPVCLRESVVGRVHGGPQGVATMRRHIDWPKRPDGRRFEIPGDIGVPAILEGRMIGIVNDVVSRGFGATGHAGEWVHIRRAQAEHELEVTLVAERLLTLNEDDLVFMHRVENRRGLVFGELIDTGESADLRTKDTGERPNLKIGLGIVGLGNVDHREKVSGSGRTNRFHYGRRMIRCLALPLIVGALLAAGCSDDTGDDVAPAATTSTTAVASTITDAVTTTTIEPAVNPLETQLIEIAVGDFVFVARTAGPPDGDPVFLLHGFPSTSAMWQNQIDALAAEGYRVIAPDQRGYSPGARPSDVDDYRIELIAGDVVGMADTLGIDTFHVIGHDFGGAGAWAVASLFPDRVRSMGSVSTPHPAALTDTIGSAESDQANRSSYVNSFVREGSEIIFTANDGAALRGVMTDAGLSAEDAEVQIEVLNDADTLIAALNWYRASFNADGFDVGEIDVPALFIWSTGDNFLGPDPAWATGALVTGGLRFEVIDLVNHWVPEVAADLVSEILVEFLAEGVAPGEQITTLNAVQGAHYCEAVRESVANTDDLNAYDIYTSLGVYPCPESPGASFDVRTNIADSVELTGVMALEHHDGRNLRLEQVRFVEPSTDPNASYTAQLVQRSDVRRFNADRELFELIDPEGGMWTMISASDGGLRGDLVADLDLPPGWGVSARAIDGVLELAVDGEAWEVHDDRGNTYQLAAG
jgi:pimeloyl-ACP methyl ester carboxylesterase